MTDFFREVDEDYRRERALAVVRRFQVPLALAVIAVIVGAGVWRWYADHRVSIAEAADLRYEAATTNAREGKLADAESAFDKLAQTGPGGYGLLARMRSAELDAADHPDAAAEKLDQIASDESQGSPALRDAARFRAAVIRVDHLSPEAFDREYARFAQDGFAFHNGMRELLALAALKNNDDKSARNYLDQIVIDPLAPPALRSRAQAFRELANAGPVTPMSKVPGSASVTPVGAPSAPAGQAEGGEQAPAPANALPTPAAPPAAAPSPATPAPAAPANPQPTR